MLTLMTIACQQEQPASDPDTPPNIIFLLTDDQRADALSIAGHPILKTPNLDALARDGVWFKNAYVTTSICCVSRASILSGQYMSRHGIDDFATSFGPEELSNTYPMLLKQNGYTTGFIGKYGVGKTTEQPATMYDYWNCSKTSQPRYEMEDEDGNYLHHTDKVDQNIQEFLTKFGGKDQPFCLSVSFKAPHVEDSDPRQFIPNPRYDDRYVDDVVIPSDKTDPKYWEAFPDFFRTDENIARVRWKMRYDGDELFQRSVKNYYRLITGVDDVVGNMVARLKEMDLDKNTVIVFMGDNGFYLGEYGLAGKWYGHEESIRVPLIVYDPRLPKEQKGQQNQAIALNIDIAPTILSLANITPPSGTQGINLYDLIAGKEVSRNEFFYEHTFYGSPQIPVVEGVVSKESKYMVYTEHGYEEMYDLTTDPSEKVNLAQDPRQADRLAVMQAKYKDWKEKVK